MKEWIKKHKIPVIVVSSIIGVLLILGVVFAVIYSNNPEYVKNKWAMFTKNEKEYLDWVMERNTGSFVDDLDETFRGIKNYDFSGEWNTKGNIELSLDSEIGSLIFGSRFAGIENASLKYELSADKDKNIGMKLTPAYKGVDIISAGAVFQGDSKVLLSIPSYRSESVEISPLLEMHPEIAEGIRSAIGEYIDLEKVSDIIKKLGNLRERLDPEKLKIFLKNIREKEDETELKKNVKLYVNGLEKEVNVISFRLSKADCREMIKEYKELLELFYGYLKDVSISVNISLYVDNKGDIPGGVIELVVEETRVKLEILKIKDEENENRSQTALGILFNGVKAADIMCTTERRDNRKYFDIKVKPGSVLEFVMKGASSFELSLTGNVTGPDTNICEIDLIAVLTGNNRELANIKLKNTFSNNTAPMPIDISESNVIDIMVLHESDYIDLEKLLKPLLDNLYRINDKNLNNFFDGIIKNVMDSEDMNLEELKSMVDSGLIKGADEMLKLRLMDLLGIEPPYDYSSLAEKPKEEEGAYLYSWDIFAEAPENQVYDNLYVKVYDHYKKLDEYEPDIEKEKNDFLGRYTGQVFEREADYTEGIEMGDKVVFDVVPLIAGIAIDSYAYYDEQTIVGSYDYGPGIDDRLIGTKKGESRNLELTLDDRYGSFAGYSGTFRITVKKITKFIHPEWSEEFIAGQLGYASVAALEKELMDRAAENYDQLVARYGPNEDGLRNVLLDKIIGSISILCCGSEPAKNARIYQMSLDAVATGSGELSNIYRAAGYTEDEIIKFLNIDKNIPDYSVRRRIMVETVAAKSGLKLSSTEHEAFMNDLSRKLGFSDLDSFYENVGNKYGKRFFVDMNVDRIVTDKLVSEATFDWN